MIFHIKFIKKGGTRYPNNILSLCTVITVWRTHHTSLITSHQSHRKHNITPTGQGKRPLKLKLHTQKQDE